MSRPGQENALTDVAGLKVGCAEAEAFGTGVTVIAPDAPARCAVAVFGGGPATREGDALGLDKLVETIDAIVLAGGSVYGLAAADGVVAALGAQGRGFRFAGSAAPLTAPIVPAAALYDLANGAPKDWGEAPPYAALGAEALARAGAKTPLGNAGAGYGARAGALKGGQGAASIVLDSGATIAALACVNAFGSVLIPGTRAFWAWPFEQGGEFGGVRPGPEMPPFDQARWGAARVDPGARANTTLAVVATDIALSRAELSRVAQMAGAGMARAIRPVFAPGDGDVVFALSTAQRDAADAPRPALVAEIGAHAADCLARAIARGVHAAQSLFGAPNWSDFRETLT